MCIFEKGITFPQYLGSYRKSAQLNLIIMKSVVYCCLVFFLLSGCKYGEEFKSFEGRTFRMEYPPYLKKSIGIHPSAPFQAKNEYRDIYFFTDDLKKTENFLVLCDSIKNDLMSNIIDPQEEAQVFLEDSTIFHFTATGTIEDKRLVFNVVVREGKFNNYHSSGWLFRSKRELWEEDLVTAMLSLEETGMVEIY